MKKELFAAGLLALILTLSILNMIAINRLSGELSSLVDRSAKAAEAENWSESQRLLDAAISLWKKRANYTSIVLRHADIETLTDDFYELTEHIFTRDSAATHAASALVREHLDSIKKMESINWGSIF